LSAAVPRWQIAQAYPRRRKYQRRRSGSPRRPSQSSVARRCSRCVASIASGAITQRTRGRWALIRRANRYCFQKHTDAIQRIPPGQTVDHPYPPLTKNYHYEIELVAALQSGGRNIAPADALKHVLGYAVGLDMTRRDLQRAMGDEKKPWEIGKSFDKSAPIGPIHRLEDTGHFTRGRIELYVNGKVKQSADLQQMIWNVAEQISKLSDAFELVAGDIIYSGTPENVGPVVRGDVMVGKIEKLPDITVKVV
jgi:fumarylpyruvate hydrolase